MRNRSGDLAIELRGQFKAGSITFRYTRNFQLFPVDETESGNSVASLDLRRADSKWFGAFI
jgi:hypothetical protein